MGQWVKWRVVYEDDTQIVMTVRAEKKEGDHTWFDIQQVSEEYGNLDFRMLGTPGTLDNPTGYIKEIEGSWDSGSGTAEDFKKAWLEESAAEQIMTLMAQETFSTTVQDDAPVVVPAGTFHGCYKTSASVPMESGDIDVFVWSHPEVPFSGIVLGTDEAGTYRMEVLDFGRE